jgi:hypothetical protein
MTQGFEGVGIESASIIESFVNNRIVFYKIQIRRQGKDIFVLKRFKHFETLLKNLLNMDYKTEKLPSLPEKKFKALVDHTAQEFIWERQFQLNNFLQDLLNYASDAQNHHIIQLALLEFFSKHVMADSKDMSILQRQSTLTSDGEDEEKVMN